MEPESRPSPLQHLWLRNFPFSYWDNRIEKISRYNSEDRLEVLYVMLQLVDLYAHIFAARIRNPNEPWFMIKENTYTRDITTALSKLSEEDENGDAQIFVSKLTEEPEGLIEFQRIKDGWDVGRYNWIAADLLGCPVSFDTENQEMELEETPDLHYGGANAVLQFWKENRELLNDFKHGFRVLPCDAATLEYLAEESYVEDNEEFEKIINEIEGDEEWSITFIRMSTTEKEDHYDVSIDIHRADLPLCLTFSRLTLRLLHNLFGKGGVHQISGYLAPLADDNGTIDISIITSIANFEMEMYKP